MNEFLNARRGSYLSQVPLMPVLMKNIENELLAKKYIRKNGIKYFRKVSAVGESTTAILQRIARCPRAKMISKFQFDPYFCEKSCLKDLCRAFKNLKGLRCLNLVLRRLDRVNESDIVIPYLKKRYRFVRFRLELPKTKNINDEGVCNIAKMLGRCVSLRYYEESIVDLEAVSAISCMKLQLNIQKNLYLEEIKISGHKTGSLNSVQAFGIDTCRLKPRSNRRIRKVNIYTGITTGWFSLNPESSNETMLTLKNTVVPQSLEYFTARFGGIPSINEILGLFAEAFAVAHELKYFSLELSNCRVSDVEVMTLAQILNNARHIKQFTLKIIQYPNLSKDCIYYFIRMIVRCENFVKFDIYLRRLSLYDEELNELVEKLSTLENLKVICFKKQSLHISKTEN